MLMVGVIMIVGCSDENDVPLNQAADIIEEGRQTVMLPQKILLTFTETDFPQTLSVSYPLSEIRVKEQWEYNLIVYTKETEESEPFVGIKEGERVIEIGTLFEHHYISDAWVEKVEAFGQEMLTIWAIAGAASLETYYVSDHNGKHQFFAIQKGQAIDLDNDDKSEVVSTIGSVNYTIELYRKRDNKLEKASITEALAGTEDIAVGFNSALRTFEIKQQGQHDRQYSYDSEDYSLNLVPDSK